jgi:hypothetical protein
VTVFYLIQARLSGADIDYYLPEAITQSFR